MDIIKLLEYLQEIMETSSKIPVTGRIMVNKKEVLDIIEQVINYLPDEFKRAQWICEEKERILGDAKREADEIKKQNMEILKRKIENHDIIKEATIRAEEIIASAQRDAKAMRLGARDYADEILTQLDKEIKEEAQQMVVKLKGDLEGFMSNINEDISETSEGIRNNIKELRSMK